METMDYQEAQREFLEYLQSLPAEEANALLNELAEEFAKAMAVRIVRAQVESQCDTVFPRIRSQLCDIRNRIRRELKDVGPRANHGTSTSSLERVVSARKGE